MTSSSGPFDFIKAINKGEQLKFDTGYSVFLANRALSYHIDTLSIVDVANQYPNIDPEIHYEFLRNTVTPRNRYSKWPKPEKHSAARVLSILYSISLKHAYDYVEFYTEEEISELREHLEQNE